MMPAFSPNVSVVPHLKILWHFSLLAVEVRSTKWPTYHMHIRICPNSLKREKQSEDDDGVNQIGTVRQPAQWNPESSRQEFIHQTLQQKQINKSFFNVTLRDSLDMKIKITWDHWFDGQPYILLRSHLSEVPLIVPLDHRYRGEGGGSPVHGLMAAFRGHWETCLLYMILDKI